MTTSTLPIAVVGCTYGSEVARLRAALERAETDLVSHVAAQDRVIAELRAELAAARAEIERRAG